MGLGVFIGIFIILFGIAIIINGVFHINIPVFKIFIALLFIFIGLRIITGNRIFSHNFFRMGEFSNRAFNRMQYRGFPGGQREYNAVFSSTVVDLRGITLEQNITAVKVNAIFGSAEVILDRYTPVRIMAESVFGGVQLPDNSSGAFGSATYQSPDFDESKNHLIIDASSIFGGINVRID